MNKIDWLQRAKNEILPLYDINEDDFSNVSTIGGLTHLLSDMVELSNYSHDIAKRESTPYTADFYQSLLTFAKMINTEVPFAKPAKLNCVIEILKSDLLPYVNVTKNFFTIKRNTVFYVEKIPFSLPYDLIVKFETRNGNELFSAYFDEGSGDKMLVNPNFDGDLRCRTLKFTSSIGIEVNLYQYIEREIDFLYSESLSKIGEIRVPQGSQIGNFYVKYYGRTSLDPNNKWRGLLKDISLNKVSADEATIYYSYNNEDSINLVVKPLLGKFDPESSTLIKVTYFETLGTKGNFPKTNQYIPITIANGVTGRLNIYEGANGGLDRYTKEELRDKIIKDSINSNRSYSTIKAIENLFRTYDKNFRISKFLDNYKERVYAVDLALKDKEVYYIPTNTLDTEIALDTIPLPTYQVLFPDIGDVDIFEPIDMIFKLGNDKKKAVNINNLPRNTIDDSFNDPYYDSIYCSNYHKQLVLSGDLPKFIPYEYIDKYLKFKKDNPTTINHIRVSGFPQENEYYTIPFVMSYKRGEPRLLSVYKYYDEKILLCDMVTQSYTDIKDSNFNVSVVRINLGNGYQNEFKKHKLTFDIYEIINTLDDSYVTLNKMIELSSLGYRIYVGLKNKNDIDYKLTWDITLDDFIISEENSFVVETPFNVNHKVYDDIILLENGNTINNNDITLDIVFEKDGIIIDVARTLIESLFEKITHLVSLRYEYYRNMVTGEERLKISDLPLVSETYLRNYNSEFFTSLNNYIDKLKSIYELTDQTFDLKIRFANTFGYTSNLKAGYDGDILGRTTVSVMFNLSVTIFSEVLDKKIKDFIVSELSNVEWLSGETYHISSLIEKVRANFPEVKAIEFLGFNNLPSHIQRLYYDFSLDKRRVNDIISLARRNYTLDFKVEAGVPNIYYTYDIFDDNKPDVRLFYK